MLTSPFNCCFGTRRPLWTLLFVCACLLELSGCSLFVMAGKMIQGDPMQPDDFKGWYGKSMAKSGKRVAVLCTTPESIKTEDSSLDINLLSEVSRQLARNEIDVIKPHKVAQWVDDQGGGEPDLKLLAQDLGADLIIRIQLDSFRYHEDNSPNMFRGRATGMITVQEVVRSKTDAVKQKSDDKDLVENKKSKSRTDTDLPTGKVVGLRQVYSRNLNSIYPPHQPVSVEQMQLDVFRKKYLNRISDEISRLFYAHQAGVEF